MESGTYFAERPQLAKLDEPTRARLRSTQILTTLPQIVSELIQNSLDAVANNITVGVNCAEWMCWVRDDGTGISKRDLEIFSEKDATQRYCTSKEYPSGSTNAVATYGFRGEALASAAQVSCLEIASRTTKAHTTWSVIKKADKVLYQGEAIRWRRESPGTVVCVRDVFFNLPVRRLSHPPAAKTWELIRQEVEAYALVSPSVTFVLEDLEKNRGNGLDTRTMRIPKTSSILSTFRHLYGRALSERVEIINAADGKMRAEGFISLHGASSKIFQFLYINGRPVSLCDLHKLIDIQFSSSSFGKNSFDSRNEVGDSKLGTRYFPRKIEMKPVYVLNVLIPPGEVDNSFDPTKTIVALKDKHSIITFLISILRGFLVKHSFIHSTSDSQSVRRTQAHGMPRIRNEVLLDDETDKSSSNQISTLQPPFSQELYSHRFLDSPVKPRKVDYNLHSDVSPNTELLLAPAGDARTLVGLGWDHNKRRTLHSLGFKSGSQKTSPLPTWLGNALAANHSYSLREPKIPVTCLSLLNPPTTECTRGKLSRHQSADVPTFSPQRSMSGFYTRSDLITATIVGQVDLKFIACLIPTHDHRHGEADSTVQNEITIPDAPTLVLIDQHAADERIRVEGFLEDLCLGFLNNRDGNADPSHRIKLRTLTPPKPVLVTWYELRSLQESKEIQEAFRNWGIHLAGYSTPGSGIEGLTDESDSRTLAQVLVEAIPEVISDKLLQEDELQNLVKGFLAQLQADLPSSSSLPNADQSQWCGKGFLWLKALRYCPKPLLNLINSKACRGAIMFNDSLSRMQCENLVHRLALTAYPFQCAHGRPSLVPLVELGSPTGNLGQRRTPCDWSKLEDEG